MNEARGSAPGLVVMLIERFEMTKYLSEVDIAKPHYLGNGQWQLRGLTEVVALFGKNGSGKSQLLRAWRNQDPASVHYVVPERTGELGYNANYMLGQLNPNERKSNSERNFVVDYRTQIVGRIQGYIAARGDYRGGTPPANPEELEALVSQVLPDFSISISGTTNPPYKMYRLSDQTQVGNIDALSSGEAQILTLALDILTIAGIWEIQETPQRIVLVDEPDAHVHPDLQVRFADFLLKAASRFKLQVVVSTHSTSLLAALGQLGRLMPAYYTSIGPNRCSRRSNSAGFCKSFPLTLAGTRLWGRCSGCHSCSLKGTTITESGAKYLDTT